MAQALLSDDALLAAEVSEEGYRILEEEIKANKVPIVTLRGETRQHVGFADEA